MESVALDRLDRRLVHALKVDGRASFARIGAVLGVSDQTVARRYARLRSSGGLRVVGVPEWYGMEQWFFRLRSTPDAAAPIADALARRTDTYWVHLVSGGSEVLCSTRPDTRASRDALLLGKLPRTPRITDFTAYQLLRGYEPDPTLFVHRLGDGLDPAEVDALRQPAPTEPPPTSPDDADRAILAVLGRDGRAGHAELARAAGCSESTARRRLDTLRSTGQVRFDIDLVNNLIDVDTTAMLFLSVLPSELFAAAEQLIRQAPVNFAAAVTGPNNLIASVSCPSARALFEYLGGPIGRLPGVTGYETAPSVRVLKRHGQLDADPRR
ncbi:Lrp/AsnC family transcriptional regulator [Actinocatenispora sera]|nr:AsnC family transcriptional regulator [Actinocatenispora sera]